MASKIKLPSTPVGRRRLLKLAALLEKDAKNKKGIRFDMGWWGIVRDNSKPLSCETSACAMGLAALSGTFNRAGLSYRINGTLLEPKMHGRVRGVPSVMKLFEISRNEAECLFIWPVEQGAEGERKIAKLIRDFVAGKISP